VYAVSEFERICLFGDSSVDEESFQELSEEDLFLLEKDISMDE
jgi:hypothetical protein